MISQTFGIVNSLKKYLEINPNSHFQLTVIDDKSKYILPMTNSTILELKLNDIKDFSYSSSENSCYFNSDLHGHKLEKITTIIDKFGNTLDSEGNLKVVKKCRLLFQIEDGKIEINKKLNFPKLIEIFDYYEEFVNWLISFHNEEPLRFLSILTVKCIIDGKDKSTHYYLSDVDFNSSEWLEIFDFFLLYTRDKLAKNIYDD